MIYLKTHFYLPEEIQFIRLNFLEGHKHFDKFIICEFNYSKTGLKKEYVDLEKYKVFNQEEMKKIEYHKIDLSDKILPAFDNKDKDCKKNMSLNNEGLFRNEFVNYVDLKDDDIIISVDADEIIYESFYEKLITNQIKLPAKIKMHLFTYKPTNYCGPTWYSSLATRYKLSKDFREKNKIDGIEYEVKYPNWRDQGTVTDHCEGCHFSWCLNNDAMRNKIKYHGIGVNQDPENSDKIDVKETIINRDFTKRKPFITIEVLESYNIYPKTIFKYKYQFPMFFDRS